MWEVFVATFQKVIASAVLRAARQCGRRISAEEADDLVQETYLRLCANDRRILRELRFEQSVSAFALLQAVAINVTIDYIRGTMARKRGGGQETVRLDDMLSEIQPDRTSRPMEDSILLGQIDEQLLADDTADARRDRRIFWLHHRQGFTARDIAALPGIQLSDKGVESVLNRLTDKLRKVMSGLPNSAKGFRA